MNSVSRMPLSTARAGEGVPSVETGTSVAVAQVPDDYYGYMADVQGQQVFFQSMIFGLLLVLVFTGPFHK